MGKRYQILVASIVIQLCLGGIYAWSSFVPALEEIHGLTGGQTGLIFGTTIATFTIAMIPAGRLLGILGPKVVATLGGGLFALGYLITSYSGGKFGLLLLGSGLVAGAGIGFGYVCPLAICMKWFPDKKGLITGLAVAGFGAGAIILAEAAEFYLVGGGELLKFFAVIGTLYGALIITAACFLAVPEKPAAAREQQGWITADEIRSRHFWLLIAGIFSGTFGGLLIIAHLKPLGLAYGISSGAATLAVVFFAVGNTLGRIIWGSIFDLIGARAMPSSLILLAAGIASLTVSLTPFLLVVSSFLVGFAFGACFVLYALAVSQRFGAQRVAAVYPFIFLAYGVSAVFGPSIGGWMTDLTGSYSIALLIAALMPFVGGCIWWKEVRSLEVENQLARSS